MKMIMDYLKEYLSIGLTPIPVRGKVANYHWKDYQFNPEDFTKPSTNIGLRTGLLPSGDYFYVIDLDKKELLGSFYESHLTLMCAPLVSTGRGWHIYLSWKEPVRTRHFEEMDIICGGYVVAPPSVHPNGHIYKFIVPLKGAPPSYNPEWLSIESIHTTPIVLDSQSDYGQGEQKKAAHGHILAGAPQGYRHNTLIFYVGAMHRACFQEEEALSRALAWNRTCSPPLSIEEVKFTVRTCYEKWDLFQG